MNFFYCTVFVAFDSWTSWLQAAVSMLKQDYKEGEMTLSSALALAVKVLNKTMDVSKLSAEKGELQKDFYCNFHSPISGPKNSFLPCF